MLLGLPGGLPACLGVAASAARTICLAGLLGPACLAACNGLRCLAAAGCLVGLAWLPALSACLGCLGLAGLDWGYRCNRAYRVTIKYDELET